MSIYFKRIKDNMRFANPLKGFSMDEVSLEIRFDPLTGRTSRVMDMPYTPPAPDIDGLLKRSMEAPCPFCPESIMNATPLYPKGLVPEGRIIRGEACLFPNLMPLDRYTGVCVMSRAHYVAMQGFTEEMLMDAFTACLDLVTTVAGHDPDARFFSVNWNYLPPAGSSILHPHLQVNCGPVPTNMQRVQDEAGRRYFMENKRAFWSDYVKAEKEEGERHITDIGSTSWIMGFAPVSSLPDLCCVFPARRSLLEITEEDLSDLCAGLVKAIRYLDVQGIYSFNLSLSSGRVSDHLRVNARIAPRLLLHNIGNSDQSYMQFLHQEHISFKTPESVIGRVREVFEA